VSQVSKTRPRRAERQSSGTSVFSLNLDTVVARLRVPVTTSRGSLCVRPDFSGRVHQDETFPAPLLQRCHSLVSRVAIRPTATGNIVSRHRLDEAQLAGELCCPRWTNRRWPLTNSKELRRADNCVGNRGGFDQVLLGHFLRGKKPLASIRFRFQRLTTQHDVLRLRPLHRRVGYGVDVSKKFITAASSQEGEFVTSTTTDAPFSAFGQVPRR